MKLICEKYIERENVNLIRIAGYLSKKHKVGLLRIKILTKENGDEIILNTHMHKFIFKSYEMQNDYPDFIEEKAIIINTDSIYDIVEFAIKQSNFIENIIERYLRLIKE